MKNSKTQKAKTILWVAFSVLLLAGCSSPSEQSRLRAVEVGNPDDSKPGKPKQPVPFKLLQVDLQAGNLEEIMEIEFNLKSIQLVGTNSTGQKVESGTGQGTPVSKLILRPGEKQTLQFNLPPEFVFPAAGSGIELSFSQSSPGNVSIEGGKIPMEDRTETLVLPIEIQSPRVVGEEPLIASKTLGKQDLFETVARTEQAPTSSGTPESPSRNTVYKLK
ncbi:MAG: hypothetical protein ACO3A4_14370 [Silvanigrellaceae bacterium]